MNTRKMVWDKAVRKYGIKKWVLLLTLSPIILAIYFFAELLIIIGCVGDGIKRILDNI